MYIPKIFRNTNITALHHFIKKYPFATMVSISTSTNIQVSHIPMMLDPNMGAYGTLFGHLARSNQQLQDLDENHSTLCIFHGPHSYISPRWYRNKPEVPTWNYAVVHARGTPKLIMDQQELLTKLNEMMRSLDPEVVTDESEHFIPVKYKEKELSHIVGFTIPITELVGKFKFGQNRSEEDQLSMKENLRIESSHAGCELADLMEHISALSKG